MILSFTVVGVPLAWPRAKASASMIRVNGKLKAVAKVYVPEDDDIKKFKHDVAFESSRAFIEATGHTVPQLVMEPLSATLTFVFPRTSAMTWKKKPMLREWHADVPDIDNLEKAILDGMNKIIYNDDRQVVRVHKIKVYAAGDEAPRVHVRLHTLPKYTEALHDYEF
jgi:Holliday junction resolvase RusA-like endonuclease